MNVILFHSIYPNYRSIFNKFVNMDKKYYNDPVYISGILKEHMGEINLSHNLSENIGDGRNFCYILLKVLHDVKDNKDNWRGKFDGDIYRRTLGLYSEYKISKILKLPFFMNDGFDEGVDIEGVNVKVDVKTMIRGSTGRKDHYANNLVWNQVKNPYYKNTHYLFLNINKKNNILEVLGYIDKKDVLNKNVGIFREEGSTFKNDWGDIKEVKIDMLEITYKNLIKINDIYDLSEFITYNGKK